MMHIRRFCYERNITQPTAVMLDFPSKSDQMNFLMEMKRDFAPMMMEWDSDPSCIKIMGISVHTTCPEDSW